MLTVSEIEKIVLEAKSAAHAAADEFFKKKMGNFDGGACGFAWVNIYKYQDIAIKGNSKMGRALKQAGIEQDYRRIFQIWNPSQYGCQNIDTLEAGARAAADVFKKYGFTAYAGSRLD